MLATAVGDMGQSSPQDLPAHHGMIVCYVDAHYAQARAAGATILSKPEDLKPPEA